MRWLSELHKRLTHVEPKPAINSVRVVKVPFGSEEWHYRVDVYMERLSLCDYETQWWTDTIKDTEQEARWYAEDLHTKLNRSKEPVVIYELGGNK